MKRLKIDRPEKLAIINQFLKLNQNSAKVTKNDSFGTENDLQKRAKAFEKGREVKLPEAPSTVPDDMVSIILEHYFSVPEHELEDAKQKHLLSMGQKILLVTCLNAIWLSSWNNMVGHGAQVLLLNQSILSGRLKTMAIG